MATQWPCVRPDPQWWMPSFCDMVSVSHRAPRPCCGWPGHSGGAAGCFPSFKKSLRCMNCLVSVNCAAWGVACWEPPACWEDTDQADGAEGPFAAQGGRGPEKPPWQVIMATASFLRPPSTLPAHNSSLYTCCLVTCNSIKLHLKKTKSSELSS